MPARRLFLAHMRAEDRLRPSGQSGQMVAGFATFYHRGTGWSKVLPGELDLAELHGGASGFGNHETVIIATRNQPTEVHFYYRIPTSAHPHRKGGYVGLNGATADFFSFGFFGKRYS